MRTTVFVKELNNMAREDIKTGVKGATFTFFISHDQIREILKDRVFTYVHIVVDYRPQNYNHSRVHMEQGGDKISYPGDLNTRSADLMPKKVLRNNTVSTKGARYICIYIKVST